MKACVRSELIGIDYTIKHNKNFLQHCKDVGMATFNLTGSNFKLHAMHSVHVVKMVPQGNWIT